MNEPEKKSLELKDGESAQPVPLTPESQKGLFVVDYIPLPSDPFKGFSEFVEQVNMTVADQMCFVEALRNPPPVAPALERAFARRKELLGE